MSLLIKFPLYFLTIYFLGTEISALWICCILSFSKLLLKQNWHSAVTSPSFAICSSVVYVLLYFVSLVVLSLSFYLLFVSLSLVVCNVYCRFLYFWIFFHVCPTAQCGWCLRFCLCFRLCCTSLLNVVQLAIECCNTVKSHLDQCQTELVVEQRST